MRRYVMVLLVALVLTGCGSAEFPELDGSLLGDGSTAVYGVFRDGTRVAEVTMSVSREAEGWSFRNVTLADGEILEEATVKADGEFRPLSGHVVIRTSAGEYDIRTQYSGRRVIIEAETPDGSQTIKRTAKEPYVDNDQLLNLIRTMPLGEGFETRIFLVSPKTATLVDARIKVEGLEEVRVPYGEFTAYRVALIFEIVEQTAWYSTEGHILLKYYNGATTLELERLE